MRGAIAGGAWLRVGRRYPGPDHCPICGKPDWCLVAADGSAAICARIEDGSVKRAGQAGFLHRLRDTGNGLASTRTRRQRRRPEPPPEADFDVAAYLRRLYAQMPRGCVDGLAETLGLPPAALRLLCPAWDALKGAWAFPMSDSRGQWIGIRLRGRDSRKWCVTGSRAGLFWPRRFFQWPRTDGPLLLPEGPTDTAAALALGFDAIGRPSARGGVDLIVQVAARQPRDRLMVVVADRDADKTAPDGRTFNPGLDGARELAKHLFWADRETRIVRPPHGVQDLRDWLRAGLTPAALAARIHNATPHKPRGEDDGTEPAHRQRDHHPHDEARQPADHGSQA